ncbi:ribonuclease D [Coriobacterium glomerans PW2]|uniref:Ribonuclease D n=1 Tax=Coriobacterium glomerans (strain ATCC 49209 / DSM 20642 / JCM 10262 / PW2) TaxID=700015 RepID=F2NBP1_CORGP|nr:ribonuclease D [Coriobacterium glomerans]AEB06850.1 ribonuclease D [Coriobacterium glomerans PW2]
MYISTHEQLAALCDAARSFSIVAIDTEFLRERTYHPRLCLVQVATPEVSALVDPLEIEDLSPLAALMADEGTRKIFHACSQDMEVLLNALDVLPNPIFDTQVAAAFLGERVQMSYDGLVKAFCGVSLPKTASLTDWSHRPLTAEQMDYAEDDVRYLICAYEVMAERLEQRGRMSWALDEMRPLADESHYRHDRRLAYKRVKRIGSCTRRQLGVARELAAWREGRAESHDIPRKWIMSDEVLLALAKRAPHSVAELRQVRGTEQLGEAEAASALIAIGRGARCPQANLPSIRHGHKISGGELDSVTDLMYALIRLVSERSGVAAAMICSRDDLVDYITHPTRSRLREGWRFELVGSLLDDLLAGNMGLTVKDRGVEIL